MSSEELAETPGLVWLLHYYLTLYRRCVRFRALPRPGGVEEQEERTMAVLDMIDEEIQGSRERQAKAEEALAELRNKARAGRTPRG